MDRYRASSPEQYFNGRHVTRLGYIIQIPRHPVFYSLMLSA